MAEKCGPQSEIILSKRPNQDKSFWKMIVVTPLAVMVGHKIIPFESLWSTTTNKESNPLEGKRLVIRS